MQILKCCATTKTDDLIAFFKGLAVGEKWTLEADGSHPFELPLVYRECEKREPTDFQKDMVFAMSGGQTGVRSFSGESNLHGCQTAFYIGNNLHGHNFYKPAVYCQCCGYGMTYGTPPVNVIVSNAGKNAEGFRLQCERYEIQVTFK